MNYNIRQLTNDCKKESWDVSSNSIIECSNGNEKNDICSDEIAYNPKKCLPIYRGWIKDLSTNDNIRIKAKIISDIVEQLTYADNFDVEGVDDVPDDDSYIYKKVLFRLKLQYGTFLGKYIDALDFFKITINRITNKIRDFTGEGNGFFDFIKCNFIGTNLKIILKYLKSALGTNIYTVGICLLVVGCSLILSISSTILLIVIINISIDENKKSLDLQNNKIPEYQMNSSFRYNSFQEQPTH